MIWLQIVTTIPIDAESIRMSAQLFLSSSEYNAASVRIMSSNEEGVLPTTMYG